jgi:sugar lactone lactonase YvrE
VVDKERSQVIQMTPTGELQRLYGSPGTKPEQLLGPTGVEVDEAGNVYVSDGAPQTRIVVYAPDGKYLRSVKLDAQPLAFAISGGRMFVTTAQSVKVLSMPNLDQLASWGTQGTGYEQFNYPNGIAFDPKTGTVYVSDGNNLRVKAMDQQGRVLWIFGQPADNMNDSGPDRRFGLAGGMALAQGYLFVVDPLDGVIHVLSLKGEEVAQLGDMGAGDGQFENPTMIAAMTGKEFAVAEWGNGRVQILAIDAEQALADWQERGGAAPESTAGSPSTVGSPATTSP